MAINEKALKMANEDVSQNESRYDKDWRQAHAHNEKLYSSYYLRNDENMKSMSAELKELSNISNSTVTSVQDMAKAYSNVSEEMQKIARISRDLDKENKSVEERVKLIKELDKIINNMDYSKMTKENLESLTNFTDKFKEAFDIAKNYDKLMKEQSQTVLRTFADNLDKVSDRMIKLSNAFSLQKLVTGGTSLNDLQKIQGNVKMSLNIDNSGFMSVQGQLIEQNKELLAQTGQAYLTFSDSISYLSNIKDYSMKNYNQATALYKQVAIGTKYLGISNQGISAMVKATNQMADDSYMNRQLAMLSALGADSGISENLEDLANFQAINTAGVMARYNNGDQILKDSMAFKSIADTYLGNNATLLNNMMSEIMNTNNFANLSRSTQDLLNMSGMSHTVHSQMVSGNLNMNQIMSSFLSNMYSFSQSSGGMDVMEQYGLGDWATMASSYNRNRQEFEDKLLSQTELIAKVDMNDADAMEQIEKILNNNANKNFWEKFTDKIFTSLGIQNQNWEALNGTVQMINTLVSGSIAAVNLVQSMRLLSIKNLVAAIAVKQGLNKDGMSSLLKEGGFGTGGLGTLKGALGAGGLYEGGASTALAATTALSAGLVGVNMAVGDYKQNGWKGVMFGNADFKNKDAMTNVGDVLSNTGKYAAIGAAIGTIIPGVGTLVGAATGGLIGALTGVIGGLEGNTEAVNKNTKTYESSDSIATKSYLAQAYKEYLSNKNYAAGASSISYGVGAGGTSNTGGYPWAVTSPYGNRTLPNGDNRFHNGIDFGITTGTPVGAPVAGKVSYVQIDPYNTYHLGKAGIGRGTGVNILGDDGVLYQFWHLSKTGLQVGDKVDAGGLVGLSGNTGYSTGPHLHFGAQVGGSWVNPAGYIKEGLFSADGKSYVASSSYNNMTLSTNQDQDPSYYFGLTAGTKMTLNKDQLFSYGQGAAPTSAAQSVPTNFATSSDIDRLIDTINDMRAEQNDQRAFMQALSGKNAFVYGRS